MEIAATITLPTPTDFTPELITYAKRALAPLFRPGYPYKKVGVILNALTEKACYQPRPYLSPLLHREIKRCKLLIRSMQRWAAMPSKLLQKESKNLGKCAGHIPLSASQPISKNFSSFDVSDIVQSMTLLTADHLLSHWTQSLKNSEKLDALTSEMLEIMRQLSIGDDEALILEKLLTRKQSDLVYRYLDLQLSYKFK